MLCRAAANRHAADHMVRACLVCRHALAQYRLAVTHKLIIKEVNRTNVLQPKQLKTVDNCVTAVMVC
jgi:hypothetical protein